MDVVAASLGVYDLAWTLTLPKMVELSCEAVPDATGAPARGTYLETARMLVDRTPAGMRATTEHGAAIDGSFTDNGERWLMRVPREVSDRGLLWEIEDLLSLVLTTGWRRAGWVPLHAAGLTDGRRGIVVCASGGGGKTTLTMAMARAGWMSLGDDKLLLRADGGQPMIGALKHMLNVDPAVDAWFPEVGDLRGLPEYSASTVKRRVSLASLWPDSAASSMRPTTIVSLERRPGAGTFAVQPMDGAARIATLLRQTVIPTDPDQARWITRELAACAGKAAGVRLIVGDDAYVDPGSIARVVQELS
ncbi:MAG TPA: hypothetical protein VM284_02940 [Candidatus Limnocylindria bacterium]|nr:hypothetical protein [Candidatus Limnocylindria bacterium]